MPGQGERVPGMSANEVIENATGDLLGDATKLIAHNDGEDGSATTLSNYVGERPCRDRFRWQTSKRANG